MKKVSFFNYFIRFWLLYALSGSCLAVTEIQHLSPKIRVDPKSEAVTFGPALETLLPLLHFGTFMDEKLLLEKPKILETQYNYKLNGDRDLVYSSHLNADLGDFVSFYRTGKKYYHPKTKEFLGYLSFKVGEGEIIQNDKISVLKIIHNVQEILKNMSFLTSAEEERPEALSMHNIPLTPFEATVEGYIMESWENTHILGKNDVVVLSVGKREGLQVGSVLDIYGAPKKISEENKKVKKTLLKKAKEDNKKPLEIETRLGKVLIYQVNEKLSLGLIWEVYDTIQLRDKVKNT